MRKMFLEDHSNIVKKKNTMDATVLGTHLNSVRPALMQMVCLWNSNAQLP